MTAASVNQAEILSGKRDALTTAIKAACRHAPGWGSLGTVDREVLDRIAERSAELVYGPQQSINPTGDAL